MYPNDKQEEEYILTRATNGGWVVCMKPAHLGEREVLVGAYSSTTDLIEEMAVLLSDKPSASKQK